MTNGVRYLGTVINVSDADVLVCPDRDDGRLRRTRCERSCVLIVDHALTQHGRMVRAVARSVVCHARIEFLAPKKDFADSVAQAVASDPFIIAVAIPQAVRRRLHRGRWAKQMRAALNALHDGGVRIFKACPNHDVPDALAGVGWSCRPHGDSRPADVRLGEPHFGSSGSCVLAAALFAAGRLADVVPTFPPFTDNS